MKGHKILLVIGIMVLSLAATLPKAAYGATSGEPVELQAAVPLIGAGEIIIFFAVVGVMIIGLGFLIVWLVRWLSHRF